MRAQSETLGFVFVFVLIILSVGVVSVLGVSSLQDLRADEATENVERAFDVLDSNVADIYRRDAPSRATEIKLGGGTLSLANETRLNVTARNTSDPADNATFRSLSAPVVYTADETTIAYAHAATFRYDRDAGVMLESPGWIADRHRVVVPFVTVEPRGSPTALGGGTALLVGLRGGRTTNTFLTDTDPGDPDANVTVTVTSPRADTWSEYLSEAGFTPIDDDPADDRIQYFRHTDVVYVPRTVISVELTR